MPQVFISYARADKRQVGKLIRALRSSGFETWWDDDIPAGASWEQTIERELAEASSVIVCWSLMSVASENVRSEARVARSRGRLIQTFVEPCEPPLFFGERQGIDLTGWTGSVDDARFDRLRQALNGIVSSESLEDDRSAQATRRLRRHISPIGLTATALLIAVLAIGTWWWIRTPAVEAQLRVAVAPIDALGATTTDAARGLTDQIRTSLNDAHIPTVTPSDSVSISGTAAERKLKQLGIGYTLEGTVEASGKTLLARLHLDDRVRHASLWSYQARGSADDSVALNYDVARSVAGVISCAYRALGPAGLSDTELLSRYLRVCDLFVNHNDAGDSRSTYELLDDLRLIMAKAPKFAPAQSDFAKFAAYLAPVLPAEQAVGVRAESARAAQRAIELDPHSADAYVAQALLLKPTDWARREALLRKAVSVDPKWPHANGFLAMLLTETGRMREAAIYGQRAAAADLQIDWKPFGAKMACDAGDVDGPIADLRQQLANSPANREIKFGLTWCLLDAGRYREAQQFDRPVTGELGTFRQAAQRALVSGESEDFKKARQLGSRLRTDSSLADFVATWSAAIGDVDTAFRFANAFSPGYPMTTTSDFLFVPQTEAMRRDPRFFALMKRYGLAHFWQSTGRWPDFCSANRRRFCETAMSAQAGTR